MIICNKCNAKLSLDNFYTNQKVCKTCYKDRRKSYYENNKDLENARQKLYVKNNKVKITEYQKLYHKTRYAKDEAFRLRINARNSIRQSIKAKTSRRRKNSFTKDLLNIDPEIFRQAVLLTSKSDSPVLKSPSTKGIRDLFLIFEVMNYKNWDVT